MSAARQSSNVSSCFECVCASKGCDVTSRDLVTTESVFDTPVTDTSQTRGRSDTNNNSSKMLLSTRSVLDTPKLQGRLESLSGVV